MSGWRTLAVHSSMKSFQKMKKARIVENLLEIGTDAKSVSYFVNSDRLVVVAMWFKIIRSLNCCLHRLARRYLDAEVAVRRSNKEWPSLIQQPTRLKHLWDNALP